MTAMKKLAKSFAPLVLLTSCAVNESNEIRKDAPVSKDTSSSPIVIANKSQLFHDIVRREAKGISAQELGRIDARLAATCEYVYGKLGEEYDRISIGNKDAGLGYDCPSRGEIDFNQRLCGKEGGNEYKNSYCTTLFQIKVNELSYK